MTIENLLSRAEKLGLTPDFCELIRTRDEETQLTDAHIGAINTFILNQNHIELLNKENMERLYDFLVTPSPDDDYEHIQNISTFFERHPDNIELFSTDIQNNSTGLSDFLLNPATSTNAILALAGFLFTPDNRTQFTSPNSGTLREKLLTGNTDLIRALTGFFSVADNRTLFNEFEELREFIALDLPVDNTRRNVTMLTDFFKREARRGLFRDDLQLREFLLNNNISNGRKLVIEDFLLNETWQGRFRTTDLDDLHNFILNGEVRESQLRYLQIFLNIEKNFQKFQDYQGLRDRLLTNNLDLQVIAKLKNFFNTPYCEFFYNFSEPLREFINNPTVSARRIEKLITGLSNPLIDTFTENQKINILNFLISPDLVVAEDPTPGLNRIQSTIEFLYNPVLNRLFVDGNYPELLHYILNPEIGEDEVDELFHCLADESISTFFVEDEAVRNYLLNTDNANYQQNRLIRDFLSANGRRDLFRDNLDLRNFIINLDIPLIRRKALLEFLLTQRTNGLFRAPDQGQLREYLLDPNVNAENVLALNYFFFSSEFNKTFYLNNADFAKHLLDPNTLPAKINALADFLKTPDNQKLIEQDAFTILYNKLKTNDCSAHFVEELRQLFETPDLFMLLIGTNLSAEEQAFRLQLDSWLVNEHTTIPKIQQMRELWQQALPLSEKIKAMPHSHDINGHPLSHSYYHSFVESDREKYGQSFIFQLLAHERITWESLSNLNEQQLNIMSNPAVRRLWDNGYVAIKSKIETSNTAIRNPLILFPQLEPDYNGQLIVGNLFGSGTTLPDILYDKITHNINDAQKITDRSVSLVTCFKQLSALDSQPALRDFMKDTDLPLEDIYAALIAASHTDAATLTNVVIHDTDPINNQTIAAVLPEEGIDLQAVITLFGGIEQKADAIELLNQRTNHLALTKQKVTGTAAPSNHLALTKQKVTGTAAPLNIGEFLEIAA